MVVQYIERHPEIEALADADLRQRIYDDLLHSDCSMLPVHIDRYHGTRLIRNYSSAQEVRDRYRQSFGGVTGAWHDNLGRFAESYINPHPANQYTNLVLVALQCAICRLRNLPFSLLLRR